MNGLSLLMEKRAMRIAMFLASLSARTANILLTWLKVVSFWTGYPVKGPQGIVISFLFSPDSQHLAYWATFGQVRFVVIDGKEDKQYEAGEVRYGKFVLRPGGPIVFSLDSSHLAYVADEKFGSPEHRQFVVLDGKELTRHKETI